MDLEGISFETLEAVKKAQTSGITSTTGIYGVDLTALVQLIPVVTPFRNQIGRVSSPDGALQTQWRALTNVNNQQPNPAVPFDYAGGLSLVDEQNVFAPYNPIALDGRVTQDSMDLAKGYADALALETINTLNQLMIGEDKLLIGAQNYALPAIATPVLQTSTSGGTIAATTAVFVKVQARTGGNYSFGGSAIASSAATITTGSGSTNSVSATVAAVKGAVAYDWFVSPNGSAYFYYTTTVINAVTVTAIPGSDNAVPNFPEMSPTVPTIAVSDGSGVDYEFNGLLAGILGDYGANSVVTPGSGITSGAQWLSLDGAQLAVTGQTIAQFDEILLNLWNSVNLSPTAVMMNAQQAQDVSVGLLANGSAQTYLTVPDADGRANISAGGYVSGYLNNASGGQRIRVEVHPHLPPGTIVFRSDKVPFPGSNINNVFEVRTLRDYSQFNYGANRIPNVAGGGPRTDFEIRSIETLVNRAPVACAVISNIAPGVA